jgi:hypothetical protein
MPKYSEMLSYGRHGCRLLAVALSLATAAHAQAGAEAKSDSRNDADNAALVAAAKKGDAVAVKELLAKGADPNFKTNFGATALSFAADRGSVDVVKLLVAKGADVNVRDNFYKYTPLFWASLRGFAEIGKILLQNGATGKEEVLPIASSLGFLDFVKVVLDAGELKADILSAALKSATDAGHSDVAEVLQRAGAANAQQAEFQVEPDTLKSYAGTYKSGDLEMKFVLKDGNLTETVIGAYPMSLRAVDKTNYTFREVAGLSIAFHVDSGKVTGLTLNRAGKAIEYKKVEER